MPEYNIDIAVNPTEAERGAKKIDSALDKLFKQFQKLSKVMGVDYPNSLKKTSKDTQKTSKDTKDLTKNLKEQDSATKSLCKSVGALVGAYVGFNVLKDIVTTGAQFEHQLNRVGVIAGSTDEQLARITSTAKELGSTTQFTATEVGKSFEYLALAGMKTNSMINAMPGLLGLAAASGEDLASVADIVSDQLSALGLHAAETGRLSDSLAFSMSNANTTVVGMGQAMSFASPVWAAAQQQMESLTAAISLVSNIGIKNERAGTAMRMGMLKLIGPLKKGQKAMELFGLSVNDLKTGNVRDIADILQDLQISTSKLSAGEKLSKFKDLFGVEALPAMLEMVKQSKVTNQVIEVMGQKVELTTTKFKSFRLETRLAQREGRMLEQAMVATGTSFADVQNFVARYDKTLNHQIATEQTLRAAYLDQGNAAHELVAAMAVLDKQGIETATSTKLLTGFIENSIDPSEAAAETFELIAKAAGKPVSEIEDFSETIGYLGKVTEGMSQDQKMAKYLTLVGDAGIEGAKGLGELVEQSQQLEKVGASMKKMKGTAEEMAAKMGDTIIGHWNALSSATEGLWIEIFNTVGPTLDSLVVKTTGFVRDVSALWPTIMDKMGTALAPLPTFFDGFFDGFADSLADSKLYESVENVSGAIDDLFTNFAKSESTISSLTQGFKLVGEVTGNIVAGNLKILNKGLNSTIEIMAGVIESFQFESVVGSITHLYESINIILQPLNDLFSSILDIKSSAEESINVFQIFGNVIGVGLSASVNAVVGIVQLAVDAFLTLGDTIGWFATTDAGFATAGIASGLALAGLTGAAALYGASALSASAGQCHLQKACMELRLLLAWQAVLFQN